MQFFEQPHHIGLGIVPIGVGVAGGVHTGTSVESNHFQTGVVGKNVKSVAFVDIAGFEEGVAFEGVGRFGDVIVAVDVGEGEDVEAVAYDGGDFLKFVGVVGGNDEAGFHRKRGEGINVVFGRDVEKALQLPQR